MFFSKKKNVIIFGKDGMLGHDLYRRLLEESMKNDSFLGKIVGIGRGDKMFVDPNDYTSLFKFFISSIKYDYCINCIAYTDTNAIENTQEGVKKSYLSNVQIAEHLANACLHFGIKLIHISTDYVFSSEDDKVVNVAYGNPLPINMYGTHKLLAENLIQKIFLEGAFFSKKPTYAIMRVSWLYGMHNNKSFIHKFLNYAAKCMISNIDIEATTNEKSLPTSTEFVSELVLHTMKNKLTGIMHAVPFLASEKSPTRFEYCKTIVDILLTIVSKSQNDSYSVLKSIADYAKDHLVGVERHNYHPVNSTLDASARLLYDADVIRSWKRNLEVFLEHNSRQLEAYAEDCIAASKQ